MISQYFIGGMMPDSASPVQQGLTVIEIRPYRGGWQCFEAPGVQPCWPDRHQIHLTVGGFRHFVSAVRELLAGR